MPSTLNPSEEAQLAQTIEMFEVITQSQPHDYQSLEILKEAYSKLGREKDVVGASKRIAQAYVRTALRQIESKADNFPSDSIPAEPPPAPKPAVSSAKNASPAIKPPPVEIEDGRRAMHKIFVEAKLISSGDFDLCWSTPDLSAAPNGV